MGNKKIKIIIVLLTLLFFNPYLLIGEGQKKNLGLNSSNHYFLNTKNDVLLSHAQHDNIGKQAYFVNDIDQYQEDDDGSEKIYGGICYAQSFTPSKGILTQLEIKIGIGYHLPWFIELFVNLAKWFPFLQPITETLKSNFLNEPSDLIVSLYTSENQRPANSFFSKEIKFEDLSTSASWHSFSLNRHDIILNQKYFIVVQAYNGDKDTYYTWSFGSTDPYRLGAAMVSVDDGSTWSHLPSTDFCFRVYGESTGEEPDGTVNHWGVICGVDNEQYTVAQSSAIKIYNSLCSHGWNPSHIKLLKNEMGTKEGVLEAISWMDSQEDGDDVTLFYFCGHGEGHGTGIYAYPSEFLSGWELDDAISELGSDSIVMIFDSCYSGGLQQYLGKNHRVLLMSSQQDEASQGDSDPQIDAGYFTYYLAMGLGSTTADTNHDHWISAEEIFYYAEHKTSMKATIPQHPQMYDAYPSISNNQEELSLVPI